MSTAPLPSWLAEAGCVAGSRVGSCTEAHRLGTVLAVESVERVHVGWDDGSQSAVSWHSISALGYFLEADPAAQPELLTVADGIVYWSAAA